MIYTILILLAALIIIDVAKNKKLLSPGIVFNGIFFITLFLYTFRLSYIQRVLTNKTLLLLFCCVIAYNIPVFIYYFRKKPKRDVVQSKKEFKFEISKSVEFVMFLIVLAIFLIEVIVENGFPLLWKLANTNQTYVEFGIPIIHGALCAIITLMGSYCIFKPKNYYKYFYLLLPILIISRQLLISIAIQGVILFLLDTKKLTKKHIVFLVVLLIVGIAGFAIIGNIRTGEGEFMKVAQIKDQFQWVPSSFLWIYSYICFSLSNLNNLVGITNGFTTYGLSSLFEVVPSSLKGLFPTIDEFSYLISPYFSVSTFAPSLYLDFGFIGVSLFCLLIGFLAVFIYHRIEKGLFKMLYMVFLHNIIFLFFVNFFFRISILAEIVMILLICLLENKKDAIICKTQKKEK